MPFINIKKSFINIKKSFIDIRKAFINIKKAFINIDKCSFCPLWPSIVEHFSMECQIFSAIASLYHDCTTLSI